MGKKFSNRNKENKRSRDDKHPTGESNNEAGSNPTQRPYTTQYHDRGLISHPLFEQYYKGNIVPEGEWDKMVETMRQQLPIAFRVSHITGPQKQILGLLNGDCFGLPAEPTQITSPDGASTTTLSRPQVLPFYRPQGNAFHLDLGRRELKRFPQIEKFREFLILHNSVGNITRQEAVSMIPPLLLDVKPHHVVLDMCAAPGSKTSQLLEGLHNGLEPGEIPTGIVIANDANPDRAYMLVHQLKRLGSPSFMVTTHEGQTFPTLFTPKTSSIAVEDAGFREGSFRTHQDKTNSYFTAAAVPQFDATGEPLKTPLAPVLFDRILCDVPCGGDGTMRKTPTVWSNWQLSNSYALHPLQLQIAWRALQLLKIGGLMVYSTCSINPIEDEAVVMELIRRSNGTLELVNIPEMLPELKHVPGKADWKDFAEIPKHDGNPAQLVELHSLQDILNLPDFVQRKMHPTELSPRLLQKIYEEAKALVQDKVKMWEEHVAKTKGEFATVEAAKANVTKLREEAQAQEVDATVVVGEKKPRFNKNNKKNTTFKDQYVVPGFVRELLRMKYVSGTENIHYTTRVLPHQQNTGGFYIALLRKVGQLPSLDESLLPLPLVYSMRYDMFNDVYSYDPHVHSIAPPGEDILDAGRIAQKALSAAQKESGVPSAPKHTPVVQPIAQAASEIVETKEKEEEKKDAERGTTDAPTNPKKVNQQAKWNKDPFIPSQPDIYRCLSAVWGVSTSLSLLARNFTKHYLMSKAVQELILCPQNYRLKVVHGGLKAFELDKFFASVYNNDDVSTAVKLTYPPEEYYRACQDGAQYMESFITKQKIQVTKEDMIKLLSQGDSTSINDLSVETKAAILNKQDRGTTDMTKVIRGGSFMITYKDPEQHISIVVAALKRAFSVSLLVDQGERDAYKYLLGSDINIDTVPTSGGEPDDEVQL